jgi:hypothetical protein
MEPSAFLSPWRIVLGLLPLPYGAVLLLDVAGSFFWLIVIGVVVLGLLVWRTRWATRWWPAGRHFPHYLSPFPARSCSFKACRLIVRYR